MKYEAYARAALHTANKEALHYVNILLKQCPDSIAFVTLKMEIQISQ